MKHVLIIALFGFSLIRCSTIEVVVESELGSPQPFQLSQPKLVVGITVDQMRFDYITKYWNDFSGSGFKRLINKGFFCKITISHMHLLIQVLGTPLFTLALRHLTTE